MAKKLQMCGTETEMREVAARICRDYLHGAWKTIASNELDFKRISGGLSNYLYYVALPDKSCPHISPLHIGGYSDEDSSPPELEGEKKSPIGRFLKQRSLRRSSSITLEEPKKVLLRIYGQVHGERAMDAIISESVIFTLLSERRLGPKLHGIFSGGRIEEYIPARPLLTRELSEPAMSMKIAEKMSAIHSMDVPLSKEAVWYWKTCHRWLRTALEVFSTSQPKNEEEAKIMKQLSCVDWEHELAWLKQFLASVQSPVVFCHNDLQEGNILLREDVVQPNPDDDIHSDYMSACDDTRSSMESPTRHNGGTPSRSHKENNHTPTNGIHRTNSEPLTLRTPVSVMDSIKHNFSDEEANTRDSILSHISDNGEPKIVLIDFEYCSYNYRGFDLANHFVEWTYDYTEPSYPFYSEARENYPTLEQKEIFMKQYLKHYNSSMCDDPALDCNPSIEEMNALYSEVEAFTLASHIFWSLWSVVNATKNQITFGYWPYGLSRFENYQRLKQEIIKKEKNGPVKRKICEVDI